MTILTRTLSAIGLGKKPTQPIQSEIAEYIADLKRANEARDNWRDSSKEWEAKFKTAATDLEAEVIASESYGDQVVSLNAELARLHEIIDALRPDAQKWRNSLKRSRDRKAAKNRGGK